VEASVVHHAGPVAVVIVDIERRGSGKRSHWPQQQRG